MLTSSFLPLLTLALFLPAAKPEPAAPLSPRATIGHYNGNLGINTPQWSLINGDIPAAVVAAAPPAPIVFGPLVSVGANAKAVGGQNWGPVLNIGTCAASPGVGIVYLRTTPINGPNMTIGICTSEILMGGPTLAQLPVPFAGTTLLVPPQPVPLAAIGSNWVSQVLVRGGTVSGAELSTAIYGTVDVCF
ncbi:MAG: hypothetical protein ABL998_08565 [Planctomycetota bacterium]